MTYITASQHKQRTVKTILKRNKLEVGREGRVKQNLVMKAVSHFSQKFA